jgi:hypothetical protein
MIFKEENPIINLTNSALFSTIFLKIQNKKIHLKFATSIFIVP